MLPLLNDPKLKEKFQIFTPHKQIELMLDTAGYKINLFGKKMLENSCGNGEILYKAVERYINDCKQKKLSRKVIKLGLEKDFVAYEIDEVQIQECLSRLNCLTQKHKIENVLWDIRCKDFLSAENEETFDYIIGNPPYIAYPDLPKDTQDYVRSTFRSCKKGKFDYSYAFIEKSYDVLKDKGILVYIIPSNIFKNVFAKELRKIIGDDINTIIDYPNEVIFDKVLVSPAIINVIKNSNTDVFEYCVDGVVSHLNKNYCLCDKWVFNEAALKHGTRLGDYFKVSSSVATLANEVFVLKDGSIHGDYYELKNGFKIEKSLLRKAASPKNKRYKKHDEYIIFPYDYDSSGKLVDISEKEMYERYPLGMKYLLDKKELLDKRDSDNKALWYEYGRSQALQNLNQELMLISSVISDCTEPYLLEKGEIPYSGLYIVATDKKPLSSIFHVLKSVEFKNYIKDTGVCVSGSSKRISPMDIENYIY